MRTRFLRVLSLSLAVGLVSAVIAQQPRPGGFGGGTLTGTALLAQKSVAEELKLTDEQTAKTKKFSEDLRTKYAEDLKNFKDREKMTETRKKMSEETTKALADILKPEQAKRLRQIEIQLGGLRALSREDVAKELKLTEKQKEDLKGRSDDLGKDSQTMFKDAGRDPAKLKEVGDKVRTLGNEAATKFVSTLADDQKKIYSELTGKKFEGKIEATTGRPRPGTGDKE